MIKFKLLLFFTFSFGPFSFSQHSQIDALLQELSATGELTEIDITGYRINDAYLSKKSGIQYYYIQQMVEDIPIDLAINTLYVDKKGELHLQKNRFIPNALEKKVVVGEEISPLKSLQNAAIHLGYIDQENFRSIIPTRSKNTFAAEFAENEIEVKKVYVVKNEQLILCYEMDIQEKEVVDSWNIKVDIETGKIIEQNSQVIFCNPAIGPIASERMVYPDLNGRLSPSNPIISDMASYRVYPLPATNPNDGLNKLILDPHIPEASPFGWHDTNGIEGAEYTITRGNNAFAYADLSGTNASAGQEPDGGPTLSFDFPHKITEETDSSIEASVVNLFYAANMAHDLSYLLGFQEDDGNYQENNYGNGGVSGDYVRVESMDGSGRNNANFSITRDGSPGRMQMYLFDKIRSLVSVESPAALSENNFEAAEASFGPRIKNNPVLAEVVLALANDPDFPNQGCSSIINNVSGKIAMMDRGTCDFSQKVYYAQEAGAVMAIICNIAGVNGADGEDLITMGAGAFAGNVNIPSVMMKKSDCDLIKITLNTDQSVTLSAKERPIVGPLTYDASFDNGIALHEYVHGISTRLTGGPSNTGCLNNVSGDNGDRRGEQMGEGWSDFFALVWTTKEGDSGNMPRGMGNYVLGEETTDKGIRAYPYSTDMHINPLTYDDVKVASIPHGVGTVWSTMLWDLYWDYIDAYGFDPDIYNEDSGNYKAAFTIMEAMKIQPCSPGFVDGRDAIIEADRLIYGGENEERIWRVFARRGLGYLAEQGSSIDHRDGKSDFTMPPYITKDVVIDQEATKNVRPGEIIDVKITLTNYTGNTHTNGNLIVDIPEGLTYVEGSAPIEPLVTRLGLNFNIGSLLDLEAYALAFKFKASDSKASIRRFYDDVEGGTNGWIVDQRNGSNIWRIDNGLSLSGINGWYAPEAGAAENLQRLISPIISVIGERPVFRFWHNYNIRESINGGFIEISEDGGQNWVKIDENLIIRNEYSNELPYLAFGIPNLKGFSGTSPDNKFIDSYIDLTSYKGRQIQFRFRFSQQPGYSASSGRAGWTIDDFELLDLKTYTIISCFTSDKLQEETCGVPTETVINTQTLTDTENIDEYGNGIIIYPNPVNESLFIEMEQVISENLSMNIFDITGKEVYHSVFKKGMKEININTSKFQSGTYFITFRNQGVLATRSFQVMH